MQEIIINFICCCQLVFYISIQFQINYVSQTLSYDSIIAQIEVPGPLGETISSQNGDPVYNSSLVELGRKLLTCAKEGDTEGVRVLMSRGAPFTTDWLGTSPLHLTAKHGKVDTSEVLLRAGCSRDARTKVDKTPLHIAAQEGHPDICDLLLSHGSEVDAKDMVGLSVNDMEIVITMKYFSVAHDSAALGCGEGMFSNS